ncbi:MAG: hypothetical protein IJY12_04850 [Clostridia bacterium]|nr:hypothetical protein [Clostridia bacterium]
MKLPFEMNSYITTYHNNAYPLGVIQGNAKFDLTPWIAGKFVNCYFRYKRPKFELFTLDPWGEGAGVNLSESIRLTPEMFDKLAIDPLQTVKTLLDNGCYVHGSWNEKYIPAKRAYGQTDRMHDYMLIGYEEAERIFYSVGYTKRDRYEEFTVTFEEYADSLRNSKNRCIDLNTCRFCADGDFSLNKEGLLQELSDYIASTNTQTLHSGRAYGLSGIRALKQYVAENEGAVDIRYTRLLMEHKALMQLRMDYLCGTTHAALSESYRTVSRTAKQLYLLSIKYNMIHKKEVLAAILDHFDTILSEEERLLPQLLALVKEL